jgi:hypothetical protein
MPIVLSKEPSQLIDLQQGSNLKQPHLALQPIPGDHEAHSYHRLLVPLVPFNHVVPGLLALLSSLI